MSVEELIAVPLDKRWHEVSNYAELLQLGAEYIMGKLTTTATYPYSFNLNPTELRQKMMQLHEYGLYITEGQEPSLTCNFCPGLVTNYAIRNTVGEVYIDEEKRGYVSFFVDLKENAKLAQSLRQQLKYSDLYYTCYNFKTCKTTTNIDETIGVTRQRYNKDQSKVFTSPWDICSSIKSIIPVERFLIHAYSPEVENILEETMHFTLVLPEYGRGDLETQLSMMCKRAKAKMYEFAT